MTLTVVILMFAGGLTVRAEGETKVDVEDSLLDSMNLDSVQDAVDELLGDTSISFGDAIKELIKGDHPFSGENMKNMVQALLEAAWGTQKTIWINILILVLAASLFSSFSGVFNGQLGFSFKPFLSITFLSKCSFAI